MQDSRRPLRIAFIITSMPVGGAETLLFNMIDRLDPQSCTAEVFCLKEAGPLGEKLASRVPVHTHLLKDKYDIRVLPRLTSLFRSRQIDAVITVGAGDKMFWGRLAAKLAGVPVICSALHSTGWPDGVGKLNRLLTPITNGFIAVAQSHAEFMRDHERFPRDRVVVVRNGVDTDRFVANHHDYQSLRTELGLAEDTPLIGIVAALRPEKNHAMFLNVAANVRQQFPQAHFVVVGDGPGRAALEAQRLQLGLQDCVHLLGTRSDTPTIVAALNVFTLCSDNEASPVSILEALACEVPVVATDVGSIHESVIENETGYRVPVRDVDAFSERVCRLLADKTLARRLGNRGRERVIATGSLQSMVDGYQNLVHKLYAQRTPNRFARWTQWLPLGQMAKATP
jgi:glycosyltransferase involved in cell wall biosynthesis